jgi:hypothetical protein
MQQGGLWLCTQEPNTSPLSWIRPIQSTPSDPVTYKCVLILFTHLRLGFPIDLFPVGFHTKTHFATCPAHSMPLAFIILKIFGNEYSFLQAPLSLPHRPTYLPQHCYLTPINIKHQVPHPDITPGIYPSSRCRVIFPEVFVYYSEDC